MDKKDDHGCAWLRGSRFGMNIESLEVAFFLAALRFPLIALHLVFIDEERQFSGAFNVFELADIIVMSLMPMIRPSMRNP